MILTEQELVLHDLYYKLDISERNGLTNTSFPATLSTFLRALTDFRKETGKDHPLSVHLTRFTDYKLHLFSQEEF